MSHIRAVFWAKEQERWFQRQSLKHRWHALRLIPPLTGEQLDLAITKLLEQTKSQFTENALKQWMYFESKQSAELSEAVRQLSLCSCCFLGSLEITQGPAPPSGRSPRERALRNVTGKKYCWAVHVSLGQPATGMKDESKMSQGFSWMLSCQLWDVWNSNSFPNKCFHFCCTQQKVERWWTWGLWGRGLWRWGPEADVLPWKQGVTASPGEGWDGDGKNIPLSPFSSVIHFTTST